MADISLSVLVGPTGTAAFSSHPFLVASHVVATPPNDVEAGPDNPVFTFLT